MSNSSEVLQNIKHSLTRPVFLKVLFITFIFGVCVYYAAYITGNMVAFSSSLYSRPMWNSLIVFIPFFLYLRFLIVLVIKDKPEGFLQAYLSDIKKYIGVKSLIYGVPLLYILTIFFSFFTSAKNMIPSIVPFSWDLTLTNWDRFLHGGTLPWEILHDIIGSYTTTHLLSTFYKLWFIVKFGTIIWQAFAKEDEELREQFFLSTLLSWAIIGTVLATIFSSVGPCFYGKLYPESLDPYAELMAHIYAADALGKVYEIPAMEYLWAAYTNHSGGAFSGISAFPSMHVSLATIFMLTGWRISKFIGILFTCFFLLTLMGSVYLGWHYAVDGYYSFICTCLIWWGVGKFLVSPTENTRDEKRSA